ncbi:LamG-like jellyroll fold domain-containing protein [Xanthomonas citri]|uniref:LamG-like jellyroll fold domain-containing protein n=1 Tax=Xanthomonas citri TaxID=346 RepID=UPI0001CED3CD|nr:LamG-like jellyroll fold domain-containing protein [Xanthomonas citri]EFF46342.1 conserved hypothetical protein [Xanthomonas citri pv. aurantifolii str. ICPB 10535]MCC8490009.1 putative Ig domain-containing protein [Xanthomonas citri pv. fuscans]
MGGKSKKTTVGFWYKPAFHAGLGIGPIDAFLQFRGGDKPAWIGELTSSGTISINAPNLWGGEKDQGGIVGAVDVMFGEATQQPNAYLAATFGSQQPAWRGLATLVFKGGKYGAMNPYPQKASYKIRKTKKGWDNDACWYPEKAEIAMKAPASASLYFALDLSGSMDEVASNGQTRLTNMKTAINAVLDQVGEAVARGAAIDCMIVGFGTYPSSRQSILRRNLTAGGIAELKSWVSGRSSSFTTYFTAGVMDMPDFFGGGEAFARRLAFFITDGEPVDAGSGMTSAQIAAEAGAIVSSVAGVSCYGINIDLTDTSYTSVVDNTDGDGVPVVSGGDPSAMIGIIRSAIFGGVIGMNPAHILYYSRTQADMGRETTANINAASFTAAADYYFGQGFGLCTSYDPSAESVEEFEQRICRVAGCSLTRSLVDGQWYLDVANGVYTLEELPILTDDDILDFQEQPTLLDSAVNSVSVKYFDPDLKEAIVTPPTQAPALIDDFGTNHLTIEYLEIPTGELAARVAQRELLARITPLRGFPLKTTRKPYAWRPGTYFRLQAPKRRITDLVCIFSEKSSGQLRSGAMSITATQDVYSVPSGSFVEVEEGVDTSPSQTPQPITLQRAFEAPYIELVGTLSRADLEVLPADTGFLMAVASDPATSRDYSVMVAPDAATYAEVAFGYWCPTAVIVEASETRLETAFTVAGGKMLDQVAVGSPALWGNELVRVDGLNVGTGAITLGRGVGDTVRQPHAAGQRIWFYADHAAADLTEYTDGESIQVKLLTNTPSQQLGLSRATAMGVTFDQRQFRPYPPGNLRVNDDPAPVHVEFEFDVTWAHRDRIAQADQLVDASMADIGPEAGVTYNARFYLDNVLKATETGIAGNSISGYSVSGNGTLRIEVEAERDGLASWQAATIEFDYIGAVQLSGTLPNATRNEPYSASLTAIGGATPYTWSLGTGAPAEFSINSSTGVISGTPATNGTYTFDVTVEDANANTDTSSQTMKVEDDIYWSSVRSLLHFDGVDASTTFTDQKGKVWTAVGNAQLDDVQSKFGGTSLKLDGSGDYITTPYVAGHFNPVNDFTHEGWYYLAASKRHTIFSVKSSSASGNGYYVAIMPNGTVLVVFGTSSGFQTFQTVTTGGNPTVALTAWTHVAVTKQGSTVRIFIGGVLAGTMTLTGTQAPETSSLPTIGHDYTDSSRQLNGWVDDFRYTDGVCRYTANFSPPTSAYPNGGV